MEGQLLPNWNLFRDQSLNIYANDLIITELFRNHFTVNLISSPVSG